MEEIEVRNHLKESLTEEFIDMIISHSIKKEQMQKVRIRPVQIKGNLQFQIEEFVGKQVFHKNLERQECMEQVLMYLTEGFRQVEIKTATWHSTILISKKGNVTITKKREKEKKEIPMLEHNREKKYILKEGQEIPFLQELKVMNEKGYVKKEKYDKFRQINRFLEFVADVLPQLPKDRKITILDFGCGKSYLTFALYHYLKVQNKREVQIVGLDLKEQVVENCQALADKLGYKELTFLTKDIANYEGLTEVDMVVTLHACDTATDYALIKAVELKAKVILSVPCCQHEINRQIGCEELRPILQYGLIKERVSALVTDALRADVLEVLGYQVQILEFIDMEHTPKNILIRAIKTKQKEEETKKKKKEVIACMEFLQVKPTILQLLDKK